MIKVRIVKDKDKEVIESKIKTIEENDLNVNRDCWDFHLKKTREDSESRMQNLKKFHLELDKLRSEEAELKKSINDLMNLKSQLQQQVKSLNQQKNGITTEELWNYCSRLSDVNKGKFHKAKK